MVLPKQRIARIERTLLQKETISIEDLLRLIQNSGLLDEEKRRIREGNLEPRLEKALTAIHSKRVNL